MWRNGLHFVKEGLKWTLKGPKKAQIGLQMGSCHLFVHSHWCTITFGTRHFSPIFRPYLVPNRLIFIWDTVGGWQHMDQGALLSVDFSKAYDTILFNFCRGVFNSMGIPEFFSSTILKMLRAPRKYIVNGKIIHEV